MDEARRIGIFLDAWDFGGVANFCLHLGNGLQDSGYDVVLMLGRRHRSHDPATAAAFSYMLSAKKFRVRDLQLPKLPRHDQGAFLLRECRRLNFDLMILNNFMPFLPAFNALSAKMRLVSVGHGDHSRSYEEFVAAQYFVHRHVALSREILETCAGLCPPAWHHKLVGCHQGVPTFSDHSLYASEGPIEVVYCGRLDFTDKRLQDLPPIWKSFLHQGGFGRLTLIGEGEARRWLKQQFASELDVGTVRLTGLLHGDELENALVAGEIVLSVSNWEGLGLGVLEAVLAGCYPVLSDTRSGHREIIRELEGGVLCPVGDTEAFATVLLRCASIRPGLVFEREKLRRMAREKFGFEPMIQNYDTIIRAVLEEPLGEPADHLGKPFRKKRTVWNRWFDKNPRPVWH